MKTLTLIVLLSGSCLAMGRKPSDPATLADLQQTEAKLNASDDAINKRIDGIEAMSSTQYQLETGLRVYDGKHFQAQVYNTYDFANSREVALGLRLTVKLGSSYEEREIKKLRNEIAALTWVISQPNLSTGKK